jgi:cysteinyl-tRNA synthetase
MVQLIQDLERNGLAYQSDEGSWYFNVGKKKGYGQQLVSLDVEGMQGGASNAGQRRGTDADEYDAEKQGARDFALWKAYKPDFDRDDAVWDTAIGRGRPGWHLECSAMAKKFLGDTIDIHCGGTDLKFPHHENEIAQSEGANNGKTFCNCWLHNGFVNIGDEKMSKSKGNFLTLRTACPTNDDVRAYRYLVVTSQYRQSLSFTKEAMSAAKGALKRLDRLLSQLDEALAGVDSTQEAAVSPIQKDIAGHLSNFEQAILDDISMPRAAAALFGVVKAGEKEFKRYAKDLDKNGEESAQSLDTVGVGAVKDAIFKMDQVFGIFYDVPSVEQDGEEGAGSTSIGGGTDGILPDEVVQLVAERTAAKENKDWELADSLRSRIYELGFAVKDVKGGEPIISRIDI